MKSINNLSKQIETQVTYKYRTEEEENLLNEFISYSPNLLNPFFADKIKQETSCLQKLHSKLKQKEMRNLGEFLIALYDFLYKKYKFMMEKKSKNREEADQEKKKRKKKKRIVE